MSEQWYWCLRHRRVEAGVQCTAKDRMGPYPSADAAQDWKAHLETREDTWEAEDERWDGPQDR